jgi:hypothetical protein
MMSVPPPAGNGTINRMGLVGQFACATEAIGVSAASSAAAAAAANVMRRVEWILCM